MFSFSPTMLIISAFYFYKIIIDKKSYQFFQRIIRFVVFFFSIAFFKDMGTFLK